MRHLIMLKTIALSALVIPACQSTTPTPPPVDRSYSYPIRVFAITRGGYTKHTLEEVQAGIALTNEIHGGLAGIRCELAGLDHLEVPALMEVGVAESASLLALANQWSAQGECPVYLVESIDLGNGAYGGYAWLPSNAPGFRWGVVIASRSASVWPHELGHFLGLQHTWEDDRSIFDTPSASADDCNPNVFCNVMSYCGWNVPNNGCPADGRLTANQIQVMRAWAASDVRAPVTTAPKLEADRARAVPLVFTDNRSPTP